MIYSAPFFVAMAWWASRRAGARPFTRRDWTSLAWLGFIGYYLASLVDFMGLEVHHRGARAAGALPLPDDRGAAVGVVGRQADHAAHRCWRSSSPTPASRSCSLHDLRLRRRPRGALDRRRRSCSRARSSTRSISSRAGGVIARIGSLRFISWAMLASTVFVLVAVRPRRARSALLDVPASIHGISLAMAIFSTVLPTWLIAEAIRRIGANAASLVGSIGPVFTIGLGAMILGEPVHAIQLAGAALVLVGVTLVTLRRGRRPSPRRRKRPDGRAARVPSLRERFDARPRAAPYNYRFSATSRTSHGDRNGPRHASNARSPRSRTRRCCASSATSTANGSTPTTARRSGRSIPRPASRSALSPMHGRRRDAPRDRGGQRGVARVAREDREGARRRPAQVVRADARQRRRPRADPHDRAGQAARRSRRAR